MRTFAATLILLCLASAAVADVRLPSIFGDNMILQQQRRNAVWGFAAPAEKVTVLPFRSVIRSTRSPSKSMTVPSLVV